MIRLRRSLLYLPGSNARALEKARTLAADALILDLEDAVAPEAKEVARAQVAAAIAAGGYGRRELVVRVNALDTPWGAADLAALGGRQPDAILVPKISRPDDIVTWARRLREAGLSESVRLWAMMETPLAVLNAREIAATAADPLARLDVLVMGTNDLAKEMRVRTVAGRGPMLPLLCLCVAAARAYGIDILDGVYNDIADVAGFARECEQGRDLGFDGKTLIHPSQINTCNRAFTPQAGEVDQAAKVVAAFDLPENAAKGALQIDGRMVERLHAETARRVLALAAAAARKE
ncbi:MAG: CoA ester lyase [Methylobacteriaceae bacterium]|nr:CoA ester lyase [Methylobacteriaceae bacterium]